MDLDTSMKSCDESYEDEDSNKISLLLDNVPALKNIFDIHCKVGEGTFSSVFLATLQGCGKKSKNFAVKHLVPTCHPGRIERELQCLRDIGGQDHVVGSELCLRNAGSVVFVMPYMRHDKFSDYVHNMSPEELQDYMKALLTALRRVHKFNIIHRDIKPSNFLYDRSNKRYLLVDFGLAQEYIKDQNLTKKLNKSQQDDSTSRKKPDEKKLDGAPVRTGTIHKNEIKIHQSDSLKRKNPDENKSDGTLLAASKSSIENKCYCFGKPRICSICIVKPAPNAPRAGTPGYRAPEVLLKHKDQTPAIDIWACGVIMLSILSGTQPFFRSPDDLTALAEITTLFGSNQMQLIAKKLGKKLIFHEDIPPSDIVLVCQKLQKRNKHPKNAPSEKIKEELGIKYPDEAYHLLKKLMDIDYKTRVTAEEALLHPFFKK